MAINAPISIEDFERFIRLPENDDKRFEFIHGEIAEGVSNSYASIIAAEFIFQIKLHMQTHNIKGYVTSPDGGYDIGDDRYIPNVGYISAARHPEPPREAYVSMAPDLVVEVLSPTNSSKKIRVKIGNYLAQNVVVWVVNPDEETVEVYQQGQAVIIYNKEQLINGAPIFPQLQLPVKDVFPTSDDDDS